MCELLKNVDGEYRANAQQSVWQNGGWTEDQSAVVRNSNSVRARQTTFNIKS